MLSTMTLGVAFSAQAVYQVGDTVENFTFVDTDGISRNLNDYKGKIIVLNFGEHWCGPCNSEWADMTDDLWNPNKDEGVVIFTIGDDSEPDFIKKADQYSGGCERGGWPWLFDAPDTIYRDYGNGYIPYNAILNQDFQLTWGDSGYGGSFASVQREIDKLLHPVRVKQLRPVGGDRCGVVTSAGETVALEVLLKNAQNAPAKTKAWLDVIRLVGTDVHQEQRTLLTEELRLPPNCDMQNAFILEYTLPDVLPAGEYFVRLGVGETYGDHECSDVLPVTVQ